MKVKMLTSMAGNNISRKRGDIVEIEDKQAQKLIKKGYAVAEKKSQSRETATIKPGENRATNIGGGWYEYKGNSYRKKDLPEGVEVK